MIAQKLRILREWERDAEICAQGHKFPDWQVLIPSRAGKRALCGNPQAPAEPDHVIVMMSVRNALAI